MKKILLVLLAFSFSSNMMQAKKPRNMTDFSGNWVLNLDQTKNLPAGLQSYSMVVTQDAQQLKVATALQGKLQEIPTAPTSNAGGSSRGGYPGGRRGGMGGISMGLPGVGMGMPRSGGGTGRPRAEGPPPTVVAAYQTYPQTAIYKLDGSESTAQLGDADQTNATSKAKREKNGDELELSLVGKADSGEGAGKIQLKERWKLSEDAKTLKVDRTIKSHEGSGTVHLVFLKGEALSNGGASPTPQ